MRNLLLTALLATCVSASAADQAQPYVKKFDVRTPDALPAKRADVQMPLPVKEQPVSAPAAAATPVTATGAATAPSGLPMIPASDPTNKAAVPAATSAAVAPSTGTPVAGQPVTTYATMAQAAKAGVDPLNEQKSASTVTAAAATPPAPVVAAGFDLKNPASWLAWVQSHQEQAMKTGLLALGILVVGFGAIRFRARRNTQE